MTDPYAVLGVSQNATDEEVKRAYRELARKYHPDNYQDNPLADLAQEKMKEVNEAYDAITKARASGGSAGAGYGGAGYGGSGYQSGSYQSSYSGGGQYAQVRANINNNRLNEAETLLNAIGNHDAEWYFLRGEIAYRRGWLDEARQNYQIACNMAPSNMEYRRAMSVVSGGQTPFRQQSYGGNSDLDTACNVCNTLLCLNCLCNGGGCH